MHELHIHILTNVTEHSEMLCYKAQIKLNVRVAYKVNRTIKDAQVVQINKYSTLP